MEAHFLSRDAIVGGANKRLASRPLPHWTSASRGRPDARTRNAGGASIASTVQTREHLLKEWQCQQKTLWAAVLEETKKLPCPTRGRDRTKIAWLLADERCSQAVLIFLATPRDGDREEASSGKAEEQLPFLRRKRKGLERGVRPISVSFGRSLFSLVFHLASFCPTCGQRASS